MSGATRPTPPRTARDPSALCAWLPDGVEPALAAASHAMERGVTAFKVKLDARRSLVDGLDTLAALRARFGPSVALRADANQSATLRELTPHFDKLRALALEWFEEPTREELTKSFGVPVALDESLQPAGAAPELAVRPFVKALVLKPTALGGLARCVALAEHARSHDRSVVASHALEGPIGFMTAAALAVAGGPGPAHGLAPHAALRGLRPPALAAESEELVAWDAPGFGLSIAQALAGASIEREYGG